MAYQIKSIRYQSTPRKILLQNKNGPCPLLAAANALLLRGVITLSPECVRNGVASTDDVVNLLADRALLRSQRQKPTVISNSNNAVDDGTSNNNHHGEYHLNEVLSTLPTLQNGMDVNPQFYSCTSIEYTHNLSTLDLLGVELVHGWVLDPQDGDSTAVIGKKSYNELIEMVIGIEAWREEVDRLEGLIAEVREDEFKNDTTVDDDGDIGECSNDDAGAVQTITTGDEQGSPDTDQIQQQTQEPLPPQQQQQQQLTELQHKLEQASLQISRATIAQTFLTTTSHQLTHHGLTQLHSHITENSLQIFFRNNHFGTITKHNGILYLLVTDLGYANAPEIIWEKLDSIDGDTEYVNEYFERPAPREELVPESSGGPGTVDPEVLLAQRSQAERDYQLALAMSRGETNIPTTTAASVSRDEEEGKLIQAAKELSLRTYNGDTNATIAITPTPTTTATTNTALQTPSTSQLESDHQMALAYQRHEQQLEHESEQLARQLEALDRQEVQLQRQRRQQQGGGTRNGVNRRRQQVVNGGRDVESKSSGCVIS